MSDLVFWFLLVDVLAMASLCASLVIQIKRRAQEAIGEALNGCALEMR
jgi:hypothetical protein